MVGVGGKFDGAQRMAPPPQSAPGIMFLMWNVYQIIYSLCIIGLIMLSVLFMSQQYNTGGSTSVSLLT